MLTPEQRSLMLADVAADAAERLEHEPFDAILFAFHVACGALALGHQGELALPPAPTPE